MSKKCPYCGNELPNAANYCLHCCKSLNFASVDSTTKNVKPEHKKYNFTKPMHFDKRVISACVVLLVSTVISVTAIKESVYTIPTSSNLTETQLVTMENGEAVTDENGENVYELIEITTEKKSFFEKIFSGNADESPSEANEENKKQSFFDKLFNDDKDSQKSADNSTADSSTSPVQQPQINNQTTTSANSLPQTTTSSVNTTAPSSINDFQYTEENGKIKITKYTGNASIVTVPAYINGKRVAYLGEKAFANNSNITKIIFNGESSGDERLFLPSYTYVFYNLPNLISVDFPYETRNYLQSYDGPSTILGNTTFYYIFNSCPKLSSVNFATRTGGNHKTDNVYFSIDGVVMRDTYNTNQGHIDLIYYPMGKSNADYTLPDNVWKIGNYAFHNNSHIKTLTLGKEFMSISYPCFLYCTNFSEFKVSPNNNNGLNVVDGVLYFKPIRTYTLNNETYTFSEICYPSGKKDTYYEFPNNFNVEITSHSLCGNPYIETFKSNGALKLTSATVYNDAFSRPTALKKFVLNSQYGENQITSKSSNWEIEYY